MALVQQSGGFSDLTGLTFRDVESIYRSVEFDYALLLFAAGLFGVILGIIRIIMSLYKISFKGISKDDDEMTVSDFFQLLLEKWKISFVILLIPVFFTGIDGFLSVLFGAITSAANEPEGDFFKALAAEVALLMENEPTIWDLSPGDLLDYTASLAIQPLVILIDQWIYGLAVLYRFFFLGLGKMTSGFAIVSLLNENTKQMFFTWLKALLICYLLIPAFLLANAMMEAVKSLYLSDANFNWYISLLIVVIAGKLLLFASSKILLWRIL